MQPGPGTETHQKPVITGGQLLTESQVAKFLNVSPRSLQGWRYQGGGPPYVAISSRAVRYRVDDLEAWIKQRIQIKEARHVSQRR